MSGQRLFRLRSLVFAAALMAAPFSPVMAADTQQAESVSVTSPTFGQTVSGQITLQAEANVTIKGLNFSVFTTDSTGKRVEKANLAANAVTGTDGRQWAIGWNSAVVDNGAYSIEAVAILVDNRTATSGVIGFTVSNAQQPALTVTMTAPAAGASVSGEVALGAQTSTAASSVTFTVSDANGAVVATLAGSGSNSSTVWTARWDAAAKPNGIYSAKAAATATSGTTPVTSQAVAFSLNNPPPQNTDPFQVTMSAPAAGQAFSGNAVFSASTNRQAASLSFIVTGGNLTAAMVLPAVSDSDGKNWTKTWDTKALANGTYSAVAKAKPVDGAEVEGPRATFSVNNATQEAQFSVHIDAPVPAAAVSGRIEIKATTSLSAGAVSFKAAGTKGTVYEFAAAPSSDKTQWTVQWDTIGAVNDTYALSASATRVTSTGQSQTVADGPITIAVNNPEAQPLEITVIAPAAAASITGTADFKATTSVVADSLHFYVSGPDGKQLADLLAFPDAEKKTWTSRWDTKTAANGTYSFIAKAKLGNTESQTQPRTVAVSNPTVEPALTVTIGQPAAGASLSGNAEIKATTNVAADSLQVLIRRSDSTVVLATLAASSSDAGKAAWTVTWDTTRAANGSYILMARAAKGTAVVHSAGVTVAVSNAAEDILHVSLTAPAEAAKLAGRVALSATTSLSADSLKFAIKPSSGTTTFVPAVPNAEKTGWSAAWESSAVADGNYAIGAVAVRGTVTAESRTVTVSVLNGQTTPPPTAVPLAVTIRIPAPQAIVSGTVRIQVATSAAADGVSASIIPSTSSTAAASLALSGDAAHTVWTGDWNSATAANGAYRLVVRAKKALVVAESAVAFSVRNATEQPPTVEFAAQIANPAAGALVRGFVPLVAKVRGSAVKVGFIVRSTERNETVATPEASFSAAAGSWGAIWDSTRHPDGSYGIIVVASSSTGERAESPRVDVKAVNTVEKPAETAPSPILIIPREVVVDSIQKEPEGTTSLLEQEPALSEEITAKLEETAGVEAAVFKDECAAVNVPPEKCEDYLMFRNRASECRQAGIMTKEECVNYLTLKHGEQDAEVLAKLTVGLLPAERLEKLDAALIGNIGNVIRVRPAALATEGEAEKVPEDEQEIADNVPLRSKEELALRVHASPSFSEHEGLSIRQVPAVLLVDTDSDGIPDDAEARLGTDPKKADTDDDGFSDWTEVKNGYNPLGDGALAEGTLLAPVDRAVISGAPLEQPTTEGEVDASLTVELVETVETEDDQKTTTIAGKAAPGTVVTIYIYSYLPVVLTTTADANGNWSYDLESSMTEGEHEAYVTINDDTGKIQAKSNPLAFFVSEAKAADADEYFGQQAVNAAEVQAPVAQAFRWYGFAAAGLIILALIMVGLIMLQKMKKTGPTA